VSLFLKHLLKKNHHENFNYNTYVLRVISDDPVTGIVELAQPLGPVFAVTPITNPTSTAMYKILICMKTRNPVIISAHRGAAASTAEAARICYEAALDAGAPEDCIQVIPAGSREFTQMVMAHPKVALILATGGTGLVKAAYSSGNPAIGVGPGNVPVFIDESAGIYANNEKRILEFSEVINAGRILVNTPTSQGAVGGSFNLLPVSLTLGCRTGGKNITTENITAKRLINIQRICRRKTTISSRP